MEGGGGGLSLLRQVDGRINKPSLQVTQLGRRPGGMYLSIALLTLFIYLLNFPAALVGNGEETGTD